LIWLNSAPLGAEEFASADRPDSGEAESRSFDIDEYIGSKPSDGLMLLPLGIHTRNPTKIISSDLIGVIYHGYYIGSFINSFDDRVWSAGITREMFSYGIVGLDYYAGLMVGYNGNLADVPGIPFRRSFLFHGDLNVVASLDLHLDFSDSFEIRTFLTPLVIITGLKFHF